MRHWKSIPGFICMIGLSIFSMIVCTAVDRKMDEKEGA